MEIKNLSLKEIVGICGENVRKDEESIKMGIEELKMSIQKHGILQPLTVRPREGGYEIVIGQRRFNAAKELNLETIPVIIKELSDEEAFILSATENIDRENLSIYDKKWLVEHGIKRFGDFRTLAKALHRKEATLLSWAPFTSLPKEILDMVESGILKETHARAIAKSSYECSDEEKIERARLLIGKNPDERERILSILEENPSKTVEEIREIYNREPTPIKINIEITGDGARALWEECERRGGLIKPDELIRNKISDFINDLNKRRA
jgi:ParB/RepB/Spo0J family partition protein